MLLKNIARRFRKEYVRKAASTKNIVQAMERTRRLWHLPILEECNDKELVSDLRRELQVMLYTLTKHLINRLNRASATTRLSLSEAASICETVHTVLEVNSTDPLLQGLCLSLATHSAKKWPYESFVSVHDITRILTALEHWQVRDEVITSAELMVQLLGHSFESCVQHGKNGQQHFNPRDINTILRCAALLHGKSENIMKYYLIGARQLLVDPSFLKRCGVTELANFCWFAAFKAHGKWHDDDQVLIALGNRILDKDITVASTPKLACRILNAFANLLCNRPFILDTNRYHAEGPRHSALLTDIFGLLGEHLLSKQLSPLDASSAIYAYAKSSYFYDMGIFDHLVEVVASQVSACSLRQISQCLWACGKMVVVDIASDYDDNDSAIQPPPYLASAMEMASYLANHANELSGKDVAQTLWAMSRMGLHDARLVNPLLERLYLINADLTTQERANILWALGKMQKIDDCKIVFVLTRRFALPPFLVDDVVSMIKPQEASTILYALGQLNIRDDEVFRNLTYIILDQIGSASPQTIANVLWAHRAVYIEPPRQLLESWASHKLPGLVIASDPNGDYPLY